MNKDTLEGKWDKAVGSIKENWGKLTDQDLEKAKGKKDKLIGIIEEKYGEAKDSIEKKINKLLDEL